SMLLLTTSATTEIDTLSLHDALPIYTTNRSVLDRELARTKRTIDHDDAILIAHFTSIFLRKTSQHFLEVYDRTTAPARQLRQGLDRKSTRLNSSHVKISYAVFCLKKK